MVFSLINLVTLKGWTLSKPGQSNIKTHFDGRKLLFLSLPLTCKYSLGIKKKKERSLLGIKKKKERSVVDDCSFLFLPLLFLFFVWVSLAPPCIYIRILIPPYCLQLIFLYYAKLIETNVIASVAYALVVPYSLCG
jgi:hypothetical protein